MKKAYGVDKSLPLLTTNLKGIERIIFELETHEYLSGLE